MKSLPAASPETPSQTCEIDAGRLWGRYRVTFVVSMNPRRGMRRWFWVMATGKRLNSPPADLEENDLGERGPKYFNHHVAPPKRRR